MNKLLGQFAAFLFLLALAGRLPALVVRRNCRMRTSYQGLAVEHSLIAITMLVVGLFAVLSWDSTFPNRRDVLVLAPLPVRARTLFLAKVAASAVALSLTVAALTRFPVSFCRCR